MKQSKSPLEKLSIKVAIDPQARKQYIKNLLISDGLTGLKEDKKAAYCALSLTSTPVALRPIIEERQNILKEVLKKAGITAYDPGTSPLSPHLALKVGPEEVYRVDKSKVISARYFCSHDLIPSTGVGVEYETARVYNKISVILHDKKIRTSRMQPNRTIHLSYDNFEKQADSFVEVFKFIQQFEPGIGFTNKIPTLLGFRKDGSVVDLEKEVYNNFPELMYVYDGAVTNAVLRCENIDIFS